MVCNSHTNISAAEFTTSLQLILFFDVCSLLVLYEYLAPYVNYGLVSCTRAFNLYSLGDVLTSVLNLPSF